MPLPSFLIAGAAKCGTTSLAGYLAEHPEVHVPPQKELEFFNRRYLWERGPGWYSEQFAAAGQARAIGEATPNYMFYPWAVERIAQLLPDVRLIVCLRDPVDRAYSHYLHWREGMGFEGRSFERAVEDELAAGAEEVADHRHDSSPPYYAYLARGLYHLQLERLERHFGRERIHVLLLDDLKADPQAAFAAVCRHLGVDESFVPPNLGERENPFMRHRGAWAFRFLVRRRILQRLPPRLRRLTTQRILAPRPRPVPPMDPAVRARLAAHFEEPNARLAAWLGRSLLGWGSSGIGAEADDQRLRSLRKGSSTTL